jgi:hypothetical protein
MKNAASGGREQPVAIAGFAVLKGILKRLLMVAAAVLAVAGMPAHAQQDKKGGAGKEMEPADRVASELMEFFGEICLRKFPDDNAVKSHMREAKNEEMRIDQVAQFLKTDPGIGWFRQSEHGQYAITLEFPPYHACAVRKVFRGAPKPAFATAFQQLIKASFGDKGTKVSPLKPRGMSFGEVKSVMYPIEVRPAKGRVQVLSQILTFYKNGITEIRLVRQIPEK